MSTNESEVVNDNHEESAAGEKGQTAAENPVAEPQTAEEKYTELNDKYLRLYSEFDNYRKRSIRERADLLKTAGEDIYKNMLPLLDGYRQSTSSK
jgi:molecular chaperone GrpE